MSVWTTISNALVAVGAKPFATTIQALRDNPIAIIESAPGAPRPLTVDEFRAAQPFSVSPGEVILGQFVHSGSFNNQTASGSTFVSAGSVTFLSNVSGTARFRAAFTVIGASAVAGIRLLKNNVEVFLNAGAAGSGGSVVTNQTVAAGDVFEWQVRREGGTGSAEIQPSQPLGNDTIQSRTLFTYASQA